MAARYCNKVRKLLLLALLATACTRRTDGISVAAAASLRDVLADAARVYQQRSGERVELDFAGSNVLAQQIRAGAPVDLFIAADEKTMDSVAPLVESRRDLLSNRLLILGDLRAAKRVAIGNPAAVPAGVYARAYLQRAGLWAEVAPKVVPCEDVRAALAAFDGGNAGAAIVYVTDAPGRRGQVVDWDIRYPAAVVRGARHAAAARRLLHWLGSKEGRAIFERYGFVPIS
jgi:molybdate transport system substrate-binding protein